MVLHRAILPGVVAVAWLGCALWVPGCVPASDRIENRPRANPSPAAEGSSAGPANATPPPSTPIRPPTSAIAQPEPDPDLPPADAAGAVDVTHDDPAASLPEPAPQPSPDPSPAQPDEPAADPGDSPMPPDEAPAPPDDTPEDAPEETPDDAPEDTPALPPLHEAWAQGSAYNALFDPEALVTLTGDIDAVGTFVPAEEAQPGLLLSLKNGDGVAAVHGAPLRYLRSIEVRFDFGERLSIEGSWATIDGKRVLLAQAITRGETRVELRDEETGRPAWTPAPDEPAPEDATPPA